MCSVQTCNQYRNMIILLHRYRVSKHLSLQSCRKFTFWVRWLIVESPALRRRKNPWKLSPLFSFVMWLGTLLWPRGLQQQLSLPGVLRQQKAAATGSVSSWTERAADRRQRRAVGTPLGALALIVWEKKIVLAIMKDLFVNPVTLLQTGSLSTHCVPADCCLAQCWQWSEALQLWLCRKHPRINENGAYVIHVNRLIHFWMMRLKQLSLGFFFFYHCHPPRLNLWFMTIDEISLVALSSFGCHKSFVHACTLGITLLPGL